MILFVPLSCLLLFKDITQIIEIAKFGIIALVAYSLFVVYIFVVNISGASFNFDDVKLFSWNFGSPAGQFCLAFLVHNTMGQMMNCNMNKEHNIRDLGYSYVLSAIIYGAIGVFGAIGIVGLEARDPSTILDYFSSSDIATLLIEGLFLIHLFTAFPIFNFISRFTVSAYLHSDPQRLLPQLKCTSLYFLWVQRSLHHRVLMLPAR
jgi:sodium-coupled neutral amino acid transporter 9